MGELLPEVTYLNFSLSELKSVFQVLNFLLQQLNQG